MIFGSVGRGGKNDARDVELVQHLLNLNQYRSPSAPCLLVNGKAGSATIEAIEAFQRDVLLFPKPDGRVDPHQKTIRALLQKPATLSRAPDDDETVVVLETGVLIKLSQGIDGYKEKVGSAVLGQYTSAPSAVLDAVTLRTLLKEFGLFGKFTTSIHNSRQYIVFKGHAGLREMFRGTRYAIHHPTISKMAIGKVGVAASVRVSSVLTVVTYAFVQAPQILFQYENRTLAELGVRFGSDLTKIGLGALASLAAAGAALSTGIVCAPLIAGFVVGMAVGVALDVIDNELKLTERLEKYVAQQQKVFEREAVRHYQNFEQGFFQWLCSHGACVPYYY